MLPTAGVSFNINYLSVTSSSSASVYIDPAKVFIMDISSSYHKKSRTMLFSFGAMTVLQDGIIYGLSYDFASDKLSISTTTGGTYGLSVKMLNF